METITAKDFLMNQIKKGMIPTCPIRAGERIDFSGPNGITCEKIRKAGGRTILLGIDLEEH